MADNYSDFAQSLLDTAFREEHPVTDQDTKDRAIRHNALRLAYLRGVADHVRQYDRYASQNPGGVMVMPEGGALIAAGAVARDAWPHVVATRPRLVADPEPLPPNQFRRWYYFNRDGQIWTIGALSEALAREHLRTNPTSVPFTAVFQEAYSPTLKRLSVWTSLLQRPLEDVEVEA